MAQWAQFFNLEANVEHGRIKEEDRANVILIKQGKAWSDPSYAYVLPLLKWYWAITP